MSLAATLEKVANNDASLTKFSPADSSLTLSATNFEALIAGLADNTNLTTLNLERQEMTTAQGVAIAKIIESNSTITYLDLGYNKIGPDGIKAIALALTDNKSIEEVKIHRQEDDYGNEVDQFIANIYKNNTTLKRCYATIHDRSCNQKNTAGEVRNKEISRRKESGKAWIDLDPARVEEWKKIAAARREEEAKIREAALAPISEKVPSTGGPYTLKQLTCAKELQPDDLDRSKLETYLADDEFQETFKMNKTEFETKPKWKKLSLKKPHKLH